MELKSLLFSPKGRLNRKAFFWTSVLVSILTSVLSVVLTIISTSIGGIISPILMVISIVISVMLIIKRWHDLDKSGWMTLTMIIPLVNLFIGLYLLFAKGTKGKNRFGESLI